MRKWLSWAGYVICVIGMLVVGYYLALELTLPDIYR